MYSFFIARNKNIYLSIYHTFSFHIIHVLIELDIKYRDFFRIRKNIVFNILLKSIRFYSLFYQ